MFMSVVDLRSGTEAFAELAGARVLISGLTADAGVDIARAFAEHKCQLIIQSSHESPVMTQLGAMLAETAADLRLFSDDIGTGDGAVRLAQNAAQVFGGLDAVVNIVAITSEDLAGGGSQDDVESMLATRLLPATMITRVAANRMRLTMTEGSILNVVLCPEPANDRQAVLIDVIRAALACITRREAQECSGQAIRINAIGPKSRMGQSTPGATLTCEPDIAYLSLYLASRRGRQMSGHVFDQDYAGRTHR